MPKTHLLTPNSCVGILSLYEYQVSAQTLAHEVVLRFRDQPYLPGVLLLAPNGELDGILSRQQVFEQGCLRAGSQGWQQAIENLYPPAREQPLLVSDRTPILTVAAQIRQRPGPFALDPIGVRFRDGSLRLVDARDILLAQSEILATTETRLESQSQQQQQSEQKLQVLQTRIDETQQMIEVRNITLQNQQRHLERQQYQIFSQTEEIQQLKQRLTQLQTMLSIPAQELFQTCLQEVSAIASSTDRLLSSNINLAKDLESLSKLTELIKQVGQRAKLLKLHSSMVASRSVQSDNLIAFNQITEDMQHLIHSAMGTDQKVGDSIRHIRGNVAELGTIARTVANATRGLINQFIAIETLLSDLEKLTDPNSQHEALLTPAQQRGIQVVRSRLRKIERAGHELSTLYESKQSYDLRMMLRNLEQDLQRSHPN